jgi:hypothetical protein
MILDQLPQARLLVGRYIAPDGTVLKAVCQFAVTQGFAPIAITAPLELDAKAEWAGDQGDDEKVRP